MISRAETLRTIESFDASPQEQKSHELILGLLAETEAPFSRRQFQPGHITCSAVVFAPGRDRVLLMFHHRHRRWLLPGGHVEETDATLAMPPRAKPPKKPLSPSPVSSAWSAWMSTPSPPASTNTNRSTCITT